LLVISLAVLPFLCFSQGFYVKPSFSYGFALNKQEVRYYGSYGSYIESVDSKREVNNGVVVNSSEVVQKEKVPLGKGKLFSVYLGYESKKSLFYTLGLTLGMMDKYVTSRFHDYVRNVETPSDTFKEHTRTETHQIVSSMWYGVEPGIGVYKIVGKYKGTVQISIFLGRCRIGVIEDNYSEASSVSTKRGDSYNVGQDRNNYVLKGAYMFGSSLSLGLERKLSDKMAIGLNIEYRSQIYTPLQSIKKNISTYYNFLGSVIPARSNANVESFTIVEEGRRSYLFESIAIGVTWKRYLLVKQKQPTE
jgi:hypothetical protein